MVRADLPHPRHGDALVPGAFFLPENQTQPQTPDHQIGRFRRPRMGVGRFEIGLGEALRLRRPGLAHLQLVRRRIGNRQIDDSVTDLCADIQRRRRGGIAAGKTEAGAVRKSASGGPQRETADAQRVAIDLQLPEAPPVWSQRRDPGFQRVLGPTILLLEMLRPQEHTLLPDDTTGQAHRRRPPGVSSSSKAMRS